MRPSVYNPVGEGRGVAARGVSAGLVLAVFARELAGAGVRAGGFGRAAVVEGAGAAPLVALGAVVGTSVEIASLDHIWARLSLLISNSIAFRLAAKGCAGSLIALPLIVNWTTFASDFE